MIQETPRPEYDADLAWELLCRTSEIPASKSGILAALHEYRYALHDLLTAGPDAQPATAQQSHPAGEGDNMADHGNAINPVIGYLERLGAELSARGMENQVTDLGSAPRLSLNLPGSAAAGQDFEDNILASDFPDGQWRFWWPWIEVIAPAGNPSAAADYIMSDSQLGGIFGNDRSK